MVIERAVAERLESGAMTARLDPGHLEQSPAEIVEALCADAVVVGEKDLHEMGRMVVAAAPGEADGDDAPSGYLTDAR